LQEMWSESEVCKSSVSGDNLHLMTPVGSTLSNHYPEHCRPRDLFLSEVQLH
jgi:hypothetical protein